MTDAPARHTVLHDQHAALVAGATAAAAGVDPDTLAGLRDRAQALAAQHPLYPELAPLSAAR